MYKRWKVSLENEVRSLEIFSVQWLELMALRTIGIASDMVRRSDDMAAGNPDEALAFVWGLFDSRFKSHPKAAEKLLMELQQYSRISSDDPNTLWNFAMACQQANMLMDTEQEHELTILNYPEAQILVTGCLSPALWDKWRYYAYRYTEDLDESIPFKKFCDWILRVVKRDTHPDFEKGMSFLSTKSIYNPTEKSNRGSFRQGRGPGFVPSIPPHRKPQNQSFNPPSTSTRFYDPHAAISDGRHLNVNM